MSYVKTLGLAIIAAVATMAFLGASSVAATALVIERARKKSYQVVVDLKLTGRRVVRRGKNSSKALELQLLKTRNLVLRPADLFGIEIGASRRIERSHRDGDSEVPQSTRTSNDQHRTRNGNERRLTLSPV